MIQKQEMMNLSPYMQIYDLVVPKDNLRGPSHRVAAVIFT
jgi:hypothetical protein